LAPHGLELIGVGDIAQIDQQLVGIVLDAAAGAGDPLTLIHDPIEGLAQLVHITAQPGLQVVRRTLRCL
jgi:hypothetical protein